MSDEDGRLSGLIGAGQRTSERTGGDTDRVEARRHARDLALRRALSVAWLLLALPLLAGPWALCVLVPLSVAKLRRWFDPSRPSAHPLDLISIGVVVAFALALAAAFWPALVASWWPFHWQTDPVSWWWLRMPTAWLLVRLVVIVAPLAGWRETWYLDQRQRQEIVAPTLSGVAYSSPNPHSVDVPGVWNPHRDPDDEPEPDARPARIVPLYTNGKARPVEMIEAPSGKRVAKNRLLAMLEEQGGQVPAGFAWREWKASGWTRDEWTAALEILVMMQAVTAPASGQTTRMLADLDDALEAVEAL